MSEPKALKILRTKPSGSNDFDYLENTKSSTFIEIPKSVLKTIKKMHDLPAARSIVFRDILATAINLRHSKNIDEIIEAWNQNEMKSHHYPQCLANISFSKLIREAQREFYVQEFTNNEVKNLIYFFAKCPHGYDVTRLLRPHVELHPVTT